MFKKEYCNWTEYRSLPDLREVDLPFAEEQPTAPYLENMEAIKTLTLRQLQQAQADGTQHLLFTHGWSTSRLGKTTSRSVVRTVMRSKEATPYIIRKECIQHESVFVAKIRPSND
jgi:hypothetical protein